MSVKGMARRASANGVGTPTTAPFYNKSSDNSIRAIVSGSGTTETVIGSNIRPIITLAAASTALTAAQSGSTVVFNTAAGQIAVLPAITVGLWFKFVSVVLKSRSVYCGPTVMLWISLPEMGSCTVSWSPSSATRSRSKSKKKVIFL